MFSTILFDLDHTLFDFDTSEELAFAEALALLGIDDAAAHLPTYRELNNALWAAAELEARSGGRWKPSPGAIYPALGKLEHRGLLTSTEQDGKRVYALTDEGRKVAQNMAEHGVLPWDQEELGGHGELRRAMAELTGPARQIGRFGTSGQTAAAVAVVKDATAKLYKILADGPTEAAGTAGAAGDEPTENT